MRCTSCREGDLTPAYLETNFPSHRCNGCGGDWIYLTDYLVWLESADRSAVTEAPMGEVLQAQETTAAMLCPRTGRVMTKYRIAKDVDHRLDLSRECNGIWLDRGEWALLKQHGLQFQLNKIFTEPWQREIRHDQARDTLDAMYAEKFGDAGYAELRRMRAWLEEQPKRADCLAYLLSLDPYSVT